MRRARVIRTWPWARAHPALCHRTDACLGLRHAASCRRLCRWSRPKAARTRLPLSAASPVCAGCRGAHRRRAGPRPLQEAQPKWSHLRPDEPGAVLGSVVCPGPSARCPYSSVLRRSCPPARPARSRRPHAGGHEHPDQAALVVCPARPARARGRHRAGPRQTAARCCAGSALVDELARPGLPV